MITQCPRFVTTVAAISLFGHSTNNYGTLEVLAVCYASISRCMLQASNSRNSSASVFSGSGLTTDSIEYKGNNRKHRLQQFSPVEFVSIAAVTCSLSRYVAMDVFPGFTILAFRRHVIILNVYM
jgi:hypothetical protein